MLYVFLSHSTNPNQPMTICTAIPALLFLISFSPANSIRLPPPAASASPYARAPTYVNHHHHRCSKADPPLIVHVAATLDFKYLRGSMASVHSILKNTPCPENTRFHFITTASTASALAAVVRSTFPNLHFNTYPFDNEAAVSRLISRSIRPALESPLNYARMYLAEILDPSVTRVVYVDSDTIVLDDIAELYSTSLPQPSVIAAPEYCHANFTKYFNDRFWADPVLSQTFEGKKKKPCYFNTGVMIMDLERWRKGEYTKRMEEWMEVQKEKRIYELGSLPPFLLVFGGEIEGIDHRWNQHGLGGDNVVNSCRPLHLGRVSLMHWSGKGKPWVRLDEGRPCAVDHTWKPYDLYRA